MARSITKRIEGFSGGVYLFNDSAPDQAFNIENMLLDPDGRAGKRTGYKAHTAMPAGLFDSILSMFPWYRVGVPNQALAHCANGKVYYSTDLLNWTEAGSGFSTTEPASFCVAYSGTLSAPAVYIADGSRAIQRWSGSAMAAVTGSQNSRYLAWWKDTLWGFKEPTLPERLRSSAPANADDWSSPTNWVDIGKGDGDLGVGLFLASADMMACKRNRTFVVLSPTTFENRVVDYEKGLESHFSVVKFDSDIYYMTRFGVVRFVSGAPAEFVSQNIEPIFRSTFLAFDKMDRCHAYRIGRRCGWTLPRTGQANPDFQIEYYPRYPRRPWTFHRMPARSFLTWRDADERLFFGDSASRRFMEAFTKTELVDDGAPFRGLIELPWDDLGDPVNRKYLRAIRLWGEGHIQIQVRRDRRSPMSQLMEANLVPPNPLWNEGVSDVWSTSDLWGSLGNVGTDVVYPDYYGRQFSVLLYDTGVDIVPIAERRIGTVPADEPHGWTVMEVLLNAVQMGENP